MIVLCEAEFVQDSGSEVKDDNSNDELEYRRLDLRGGGTRFPLRVGRSFGAGAKHDSSIDVALGDEFKQIETTQL